MKNVTVSMDDRLAQEVRVEAAKAGKSMSRYISEVVEAAVRASAAGEMRNRQLEAIEAILSGPVWDVTEDGRMPTADERNARR
jgi:metal-responsive CopG/Arc/MetJ family transcriptional regulator